MFGSLRKLLVAAKYDDGRPFLWRLHFVGFDAHKRIAAHPLDFLPNRRKAVEVGVLVSKIEWRDVRLALSRAGQPAELVARQKIKAGLSGHFLDQHDCSP